IDLSSGSVTALCDAPLGRGGAWSKDGVILFAPDFRTGLFKVSASGGEPIATTKLDSTHNTNRWPYFLPDAKRFLYLASNQEAPKGAETAVYLGSLDGRES